jgi:periplasmic protein TonB
MLGTLIESERHVRRSAGGSLISILAHGALVVSAVVATTTTHLSRPVTVDPPPIFVRPVQPTAPVSTRPTRAGRSDQSASPAVRLIRMLIDIPTDAPPGDVLTPPTAQDFTDARAHQPFCGIVCPVSHNGNGGGVTTWTSSEMQMQLRETPKPPRYPERLRSAGIEGSVLVKFVVDTMGRVDPSSVEVLASTHDLFTAAVRETLTRLSFNPASDGTRKIRAAAIMPFQFTLR